MTTDQPTEETPLTDNERAEADRQAVADVIEGAHVAVVTTIAEDGSLVSRPLALLGRPFDGELHFLVPDPSDKTEQVKARDQVNIAIQHAGSHLSIAGTATVTKDQAVIDEVWNPAAEAWFDQGRQDPAVAVLRVVANSAELIALDSSGPVRALKYARAMLTKEQPDVGDATRVKL